MPEKYIPAVLFLCLLIFAVAILIFDVEIMYALESQNFSDDPDWKLAVMYELVDRLDEIGFNETISSVRTIWSAWVGL